MVPILLLGLGCATTVRDSGPPDAAGELPPEPSVAAAPSAAASAAVAEQAPPCDGDQHCVAEGVAHEKAGEPVDAQRMYQAGCDQDGVESCGRLAALVSKSDPSLALFAWTKACDRGNARSCFNLAEGMRDDDSPAAIGLYAKACATQGVADFELALMCDRGARTAYFAEDYTAARSMAERICTPSQRSGCVTLGVLHVKGQGVPVDLARARDYFQQGCDAQDAEACGHLKVVERALEREGVEPTLQVKDANVSIGSITVDGLAASDLQCRGDAGGGLFGGAMGAISGIAKRKKRLRACAKQSEEVRARWTTSGGRIKKVDVEASSKDVRRCVQRTIEGATAAFGGTCAATFSIGN